MFFQLPKVSNENLIKWPHKNKNQTPNDTLQLIQSAGFYKFLVLVCQPLDDSYHLQWKN